MNELKTLNDLNEANFKGEIEGNVLLISKEDLKKEAIKWVNEIIRKRKLSKDTRTREGYIAIETFFGNFFNITEEDLK